PGVWRQQPARAAAADRHHDWPGDPRLERRKPGGEIEDVSPHYPHPDGEWGDAKSERKHPRQQYLAVMDNCLLFRVRKRLANAKQQARTKREIACCSKPRMREAKSAVASFCWRCWSSSRC